MIDDLSCVVVHHNSMNTLTATVASLLEQGIDRGRMVVVDNSAPARPPEPTALGGVEVLQVPNRGYASAVNAGIEALARQGRLASHLLVSTHECLVLQGSLDVLVEQLRARPRAAVVGPVLVNQDDVRRVWSMGGIDSRVLGLPGHRHHGEELSSLTTTDVVATAWLDGAFCVYRTAVFDEVAMDEQYFMYFEENDFHHELALAGYEVLCLPRVVVSQASGGMPDFYLARNARRMLRKHRGPLRGDVAALVLVLRRLARNVVSRSGSLADLRRGWSDGRL